MEKKMVVGVIGLVMGRHHLKGLVDKNIEVAAICDINEELLKEQGDLNGIPEEKRFTDWKEMLKIEEMNAVLIITPDQLHREMSVAFLEAGKHVMCEKPLAIVREDLDAIVAAAEKASTVFMVGQICRFTPRIRQGKAAR